MMASMMGQCRTPSGIPWMHVYVSASNGGHYAARCHPRSAHAEHMRRSTSSLRATVKQHSSTDINDKLSLLDVDSQRTLDAQQVTISRLRAENSKLRGQLQEVTTWGLSQPSREDQLKELLEFFNHKLDEENRQVLAIEKEVAVTQAKVAALRRSTVGQPTPNEQARQVSKHLQILEGRLEKSLAKFSETLLGNKVLREEIEQMHKELTVLHELRGRHLKALQLKRDKLAGLNQGVGQVGEAAKEASTQADALWVLDEKEQQLHDQEVAELERLLTAAKQLEGGRGQQQKGERGSRWGDSDKEVEQVWRALQKACGGRAREEVVAQAMAAEERNYTLFVTCSKADQTVRWLQQELQQLRAEVQQLKGSQEYVQGKEVVRELQLAVDQLRQRSQQYSIKAAEHWQALEALQPAVALLAGTIGLQHSQETDSSDMPWKLLQLLACIERHVHIVVSVYAKLLNC